ncbi:uncharacterized protein LOC105688992 [Athalia rosae]|uniref:uncharacterized protein LOC105688992 n=1 Tax=Athalia rosae TaxID=37344 RepID=UPI002033F976|nr:uncharacterized protein LOC105688992 [Athalia rosae]
MEKPPHFQITKPNDTSKYNLRCNRNISEKMTKKDFIYDIPAPFQAIRKERYGHQLQHQSSLKKSRDDIECLVASSKNPVRLLTIIPPQKLHTYTPNPRSSTSTAERIAAEKRDRELAEDTGKEIRRQIVLPLQIRRKIGADSKLPRYVVIQTNQGNRDDFAKARHELLLLGDQIPERRILGHQCNYCQERIATFMSLSTHVKGHRHQRHCKICYWILKPEESMTAHIQKSHPSDIINRAPFIPEVCDICIPISNN